MVSEIILVRVSDTQTKKDSTFFLSVTIQMKLPCCPANSTIRTGMKQ